VKRVLFVIPYMSEGGAERALSNITTHFPTDWDIDILLNDDKVIDFPLRGNILTLGLTEEPRTGSVIFQFKVFLKRVKKLRKLKKNGGYKACISFLDSANIANILSGKKYCKVILSVRNSLVQSARMPQYRYIVNPLVKVLYNRSDGVVAVSKGLKNELVENFKLKEKKVIAIENGYDLDSINRQAEEKLDEDNIRLLSGHKLVVTTGRLTDQKGQWHLIRAFASIAEQLSDTLLVIVGAGELEVYLKGMVKEGNLEDRVVFTGHVNNPYQYERQGDIFVLPSLYEGFPNALAEAVCLGMPCIATDFRTGAREILNPNIDVQGKGVENIVEAEYGILVPVCSGRRYVSLKEPLEYQEECLANAIVLLLTKEEIKKQYKRKSEERRNGLSIDATIKKWIDFIQ